MRFHWEVGLFDILDQIIIASQQSSFYYCPIVVLFFQDGDEANSLEND